MFRSFQYRFELQLRNCAVFACLALAINATAQNATQEPIVELTPFEVSAARATGDRYTNEQSTAGTIIAKDRDKIPMVTSILTEEFINDLRLDDTAQYTQFISGVSNSVDGRNFSREDVQSAGHLNYMVRGFNSEPLFNGFKVDGLVRNPDNVGRIEVIKTPNSVLYGQGAAGGIIDISTKVPTFGPQTGSILVGAGESDVSPHNSSLRGRVDLNGSWGENAAFRLNAGYQQFEKEQYYFKSNVFGLGGALKYRLGRRVTLDLASELTMFDGVPSRTSAYVSTGTGPARVVDPYNRLRMDRNFSYTGPYSHGERTTNINSANVTVSLTESITVRLGALYGTQTADSLLYNTNLSLAETDLNAFWARITEDEHINDQKIDLVHEGEFRGWKIDSVFGYENHSSTNNGTNFQTNPAITPTPITLPFTNHGDPAPWPRPPAPTTFTVQNTRSANRLAWTNARFSQFIETPNKKGSIMWGVAHGEGDNTTRNLVNGTQAISTGEGNTYTGGLTYELFHGAAKGLINKVIVFGGTSTSFTIQGGNQQNPNQFTGFTTVQALKDYIASLAPHAVDPQQGKGWETGIRIEALNGRLKSSISYFDQTRENIVRSFFVRQSLVPGETNETALATYSLASGKENSKGLDADVRWQITKSVSLIAGAMLGQGKVLSNPESPEEVGFGLISSPETQLNGFVHYKASKESKLSGLSLGLGASYKSRSRIRPEVPDRFRISDAYTQGVAMIRYAFPIGKYSQEVGLNIDNLFNEEYVDEGNFLSAPRTFKLSYTISW